MGLETTTNLFRTEGVFGCDISTFFIRNKMNKIKRTGITDEVREWTGDILKYYNKSNFESMNKILDELTPKLKEGVIQYLNGFIIYINGWSDDDSEKKWKLLNFKVVKELVQKHLLHQNFDTNLLWEMKDVYECSEETKRERWNK